MGELLRIGEYALPKLKLVMTNKESPQNLLDDTSTVILLTLSGDERTNDLINRCGDENEDVWIPAQEEVRNIINEIDLLPYFIRPPEKLEEMNKP